MLCQIHFETQLENPSSCFCLEYFCFTAASFGQKLSRFSWTVDSCWRIHGHPWWFLTSGAHSSELICKKELNLFLIFYSYQKANLDEKRQFRLYLSVVVSTCLFFIVFYFFNIFNIAMFGGFLLMALVNVTLLLHTSPKVYRLSKSTRLSDHAWFEIEKERYSNLQIFPRKRLLLPLCE